MPELEMCESVMVTITSGGRIPFLNVNGPILTPTIIKKSHARALIGMGHKVVYAKSPDDKEEIIEDEITDNEGGPAGTQVPPVTSDVKPAEDVKPEDITPPEDVKPEDVKPAETNEDPANDDDETSADETPSDEVDYVNTVYTKTELTELDRAGLRKILKARNISVKTKQTDEMLVTNILNSNVK